MTDLPRVVPHLTPRELAVAAMLGRCLTVRRIAFELDVTDRRVCALITAIAHKIGVPDGCDDKLTVAEWWRTNVIQHDNLAA